MTNPRHPKEIAKEIRKQAEREFDAWSVRHEDGEIVTRTFVSEDEADAYRAHLADMYGLRETTSVRVRVTIEEVV